jgi:hypothetical protein
MGKSHGFALGVAADASHWLGMTLIHVDPSRCPK